MNSLGGRAILVGIDDGEARHVALEFAAGQALAEEIGPAPGVHVVHPLTKAFVTSKPGSGQVHEATSAATELLEEASTLARALTGGRVRVLTSVLEGIPLDVLLSAADESDRIVLQRRHLSALDDLITARWLRASPHAPRCRCSWCPRRRRAGASPDDGAPWWR